ncbi:histidine--tRNA ligase [Tetragenococcus koreensis]|uniref:Histidine--tRNA ligase n=1 Tax=Tetragenococcus koreensis TaxID=290335 RepID=A0AAN4ZPR4_9ENTE|nr:histidine--tRNA ligase [Tetragenococcus koreensis]GEQ49640.1 histidyl-tRNA synthetase [Tetragenococcus koreensis]GEQ52086.1 histidyl-tRNA synthetase [Tetragenococcus koreensis]GEQ54621.1 histidyl-tRNA synthetase [Tetragenococcus koreensis]GEQ57099.1 histidyl-tRNA synthetase [Tetragenococcus koreensis]GEQ59653.1 histidyl-tRNA synthetase [Tetragenococcus koreensis]
MKYKKPKGTEDILSEETGKWQFIEETAYKIFRKYNFYEVRTPIFEHFEVFVRSVGETTDIVSKEMYDFYDKGNRHIALRPEGTAAFVRSYVEHKRYAPEYINPFKGYYIGPMFRYERPQSGRLRQFHQIGVEVIGSQNPMTDVETMAMALDFFESLGVTQLKLVINTLGNKSSRLHYIQALVDYFSSFKTQLSEDSQRRLKENPLRILDSKEEQDKEIVKNTPSIFEYLDEESTCFFEQIKRLLDQLDIVYIVDPTMVRGLDYYNHTVFEIMSLASGFGGILTTLCAGGRYDGLIYEFGGPEEKNVGFGFALGIERLLIAIEAEQNKMSLAMDIDIFVACLDKKNTSLAQKASQIARSFGLITEQNIEYRKLKSQLRIADRAHAKYVLIFGENEVKENNITVRKMQNGTEKRVAFEQLTDFFETITN